MADQWFEDPTRLLRSQLPLDDTARQATTVAGAWDGCACHLDAGGPDRALQVLYAFPRRIAENVRRLAAGEDVIGVVDPHRVADTTGQPRFSGVRHAGPAWRCALAVRDTDRERCP